MLAYTIGIYISRFLEPGTLSVLIVCVDWLGNEYIHRTDDVFPVGQAINILLRNNRIVEPG